MLFRGDSDVAVNAQFGGVPVFDEPTRSISEHPPVAVEDPELARLRAENEELRLDLAEQRERWNAALAEARLEAEQDILSRFRKDDAARIAILERACSQALASLDGLLGKQMHGAAVAIASDAVAQLASLHEEDVTWLARIINQRLAQLRSGSHCVVHVAPEHLESVETTVQNCKVVADPAIPSGTAVIKLALGEIEIDPAQGSQRLIAALLKQA